MSNTTVQATQTSAYHTNTTTIAEALRRIADALDESPIEIAETWAALNLQVIQSEPSEGYNRLATIELLDGMFSDEPPTWHRTKDHDGMTGLYSGRQSNHLGASYHAYGADIPMPTWVPERDETAAYDEAEARVAAANAERDRLEAEQVTAALKAYRALDPWHTPEDAVNAIRGALGIPTDEVTQELDCPPRYIESSADIIDGQGDRWIYLGDDRYTLSDAASLALSRRVIREKYGIPNETAAERAEYDRRAGEASNELGAQVVDEAMATYEHDPSIAEAVVDTIDGTPSLPVGAYVATPVLDATAGTITATAAPLPDSDEPKPWYRCSSESCGSTADQPCNLIADAVIAAHRTDAS